MAGTLVIDTVKSSTSGPPSFQNTSGTEVGQLCSAWVNFNGTSPVNIRASFNVSSVTRNATGDYTVNFSTSMVDASYSVSGYCVLTAPDSGDAAFVGLRTAAGTGLTTSNISLRTQSTYAVTVDCLVVSISIFR